MTTQRLGDEGFRWFIGTVEDRNDPQMLGRVRVRIFNHHSEKQSKVPTSELPWAYILNSPNSASQNKVGISPTGMQVGSTVVGFFMDGRDGNNPVIMGTLMGIQGSNHDVSNEAREINSIRKTQVGIEPESAYKSKYPYNKVITTESGHCIEVDDTPGSERIHLYHKSGTYIEINQAGRMVTKVADSDYEIVIKDKNIDIKGNVNINVDGSVNGKASVWNIIGDVNVDGTITATGDVIGAGVSLDNHTHPDAQGGSTGAPS